VIIEGRRRAGATVREKADVAIVGTGAGGATLGVYLAERGWDVVMLEKGGFWRAQDFTQLEQDAMADFNGRRGMDASADNSIFLSYAEAVGGTTVHYWGDCLRTPPDRLAWWRESRGIDWMTPAELNPHWDEIWKDLGIHPAGPNLVNENNALVRKGCETLGYDGAITDTARVDCIACGWTEFGCAYNRKSSQLITTIPRISRAGGRVYSDAQVTRVVMAGGRARGVEGSFIDRATKAPIGTFRVDADIVVVAAGSLGTAELLLRNFDDPTVGRRLYINPHYWIFADFGRQIGNVTGIPCAYIVHEFRRKVVDRRGDYVRGGYIMLCSHESPGITAAMMSAIGSEHLALMRDWRHYGSVMSVIDEDNPGRVYLDRQGLRRVDYQVRGLDRHKAVDYLKNASRIFLAAGAQRVIVPDVFGTVVRDEHEVETRIGLRSVQPNAQFTAGSHLLGTAPLGADPADAFAGPTGEAHRVPGLYVADGAAVPTSVSVDPSITIMGVARHIAAGLHERHGRAGS
jgi:choline dehydrogenase-like flavoprotein